MLNPQSLDEAIDGALRLEAQAFPGFVRPPREILGRPYWDQRFTDSCRQAVQRLVRNAHARGVLAICSARDDEGRSTVAAATAMALTRAYGDPVALLDLDFRTPSLANIFSIAPAPGLADFLEGREMLRAIPGGPERKLIVVPAGIHQDLDPSRLTHEMVRRGAVEAFRHRFHWVVLDLPPLMDHPEAARIASLTDWRVLVGRHRRTTLVELERAAELIGHPERTGFLLTGDSSRIPGWIRRLI